MSEPSSEKPGNAKPASTPAAKPAPTPAAAGAPSFHGTSNANAMSPDAQNHTSTMMKVGLFIAAALIAYGWAVPFYEMWYRWYPAWRFTHKSITQRLSEGDSYYSHGLLVPIVSLIIAWMIYKRVGLPTKRTLSSNLLGWAALLLCLLAHLSSAYARVTFVSGFALVGVIASMVTVWGGWSLLRAYALPIGFLVFMVPLPMEMIADINLRLKFMAGSSAVWLTNHVFGVPAEMYDSMVAFMPGPDGVDKTLIIEDVCSGLRSLISLICFSALFAAICRVKGFWRLFMLAMALPVAVGCNICRITTLNLVAHYFTVEDAGPDSWVHDFTGLAVFALALAFLFLLEQSILFTGKKLGRNWGDPRLLAYLDTLPRNMHQRACIASPVPLVLLGVVAVGAAWLATQSPAQNRSDLAAKALPMSIQIHGEVFTGMDIEMDEQVKVILETDDMVYRRYRDGTGRIVDMLVVFSADNRKGTHPPEVCLKGANTEINAKRVVNIDLPEMGPMDFRELETTQHRVKAWHLYLYKSGDSYTPSFFKQQLVVFVNGLLQRNAGGALIHLTVPVMSHAPDAVAQAKALEYEAARILMPQIHKNLP